MENNIVKAALAGLIHDIGKLEQRARDNPWEPAPGIELEGQPVHATWTTYFVQQYIPQKYHAAAFPAAYHHAPEKSPAEDKHLSELVALADKLSAGERADLEQEGKRSPKQLVSIFDRINLHGQGKKEGWHYLGLQKLSLKQQAIFPREVFDDYRQQEAYEKLCEHLRSIAHQNIDDDLAYLENLLSAMQQVAWCVPSAYYHSIPDVSFYDHSRMTAALAACLSDLEPAVIRQLLAAVRRDFKNQAEQGDDELLNQNIALLIGGDVSGVQDFIYTISSKGAARTLRGRSFYLQLLTEAILRYVLSYLELPSTNVIYSGGGHFYILTPLSAMEQLSDIQGKITRKLFTHHGASLYLALGYTSVPATGFRIGKFPFYWGKMHAALARAKKQRYTELKDDLYKLVFTPPETGGNPDRTCSVCGEDHLDVEVLDEAREEQARICSLCNSFSEEIGNRLPEARFVVLGLGEEIETTPGNSLDVLKSFGMYVHFVRDERESIDMTSVKRGVIWALGDPVEDHWPSVEGIPTIRFIRYSVNHIPVNRDEGQAEKINKALSDFDRRQDPARAGRQKTFTHLQAEAKGIKRLGVLRMDVDNLGDIFSHGFGTEAGNKDSKYENIATLARLSTLSFQMSLFFEGWVKHLCELPEYRDSLYAVYAGGDDLFLIGPWDVIPELAERIVVDFTAYTSQHPAIHMSGGMAMIGGKYPVYQAAHDAAEALDQAKRLAGKNAFTFLGQAWPWQLFKKVGQKRSRLKRLVETKDIEADGLKGPQAIVQVLRRLALLEADEARRRGGRPVWGPWMWLGAYRLKRMSNQYEKNKPEVSKEVDSIREELGANNYSEINQWGSAARWVQLETRKTQGKENK